MEYSSHSSGAVRHRAAKYSWPLTSSSSGTLNSSGCIHLSSHFLLELFETSQKVSSYRSTTATAMTNTKDRVAVRFSSNSGMKPIVDTCTIL
uniref:Uncharacterized protein n=1 Tax=Romanomermis culicivorax TaxID=13658 RepID=A0A915I1F0_ROMCU